MKITDITLAEVLYNNAIAEYNDLHARLLNSDQPYTTEHTHKPTFEEFAPATTTPGDTPLQLTR